MSSSTIDPGDKSPSDMENDVERTRANVAGTLDALRDRLAPSQIVDEVIDRVSDYARGTGGAAFARNLGSAVRENPLPVLLIGAGVGWLMLSGVGSGTSQQERDPLRLPSPRRLSPEKEDKSSLVHDTVESVSNAAGAIGDGATRAGSYVGETASRVSEVGSDLARGVMDSGASASRKAASFVKQGWPSASGLVEAQPLLLGLLGVAVGAALGAVLPRTEVEGDLLGEAADAATERVSDFGRETAEQVRAVAGEHLQSATGAVAEGYAKVKQRLDEGSLSGAGEALGEALTATTQAAGDAARGLVDEARDRLGKDEKPGDEGRKD